MEGDGLVYKVAGHIVAKIDEDSLKIVTLLHDLCKTNFYEEGTRNQKTYDKTKVANAQRWQIKEDSNGKFIWETVPTYAVNDKNPYGHGEKSVMMIEEFMKLSMEERYAIRWHMGMGDCTYNQIQAFNASCEKFPLVLLLHNTESRIRVYIAGPIASDPDYEDNFTNAHIELLMQGYIVENPVEEGKKLENPTYEEYMESGMKQLKKCDMIYMLKNWKQSPGANRELGYAMAKNKIIMFEEKGDEIDVREI